MPPPGVHIGGHDHDDHPFGSGGFFTWDVGVRRLVMAATYKWCQSEAWYRSTANLGKASGAIAEVFRAVVG